MITLPKCKIKGIKSRVSYGGKLITRVTIDFDSQNINRDKFNELTEWFLKRREPTIELKLQEKNSTLDKFEKAKAMK